jgi:hypothetical protein
MCSNPGGNLFSRIMFIDYTNYNNPYYFDITGCIEQNYPSWSPGNAEGIATTCRLEYDSIISAVSIEEFSSKNQTLIYPNPTQNSITIKSSEISEVIILNPLGHVVYVIKNKSPLNYQQIDLSNLCNGVYFLKVVNSDSEILIKKIIKN